jgi:hypothetical protein
MGLIKAYMHKLSPARNAFFVLLIIGATVTTGYTQHHRFIVPVTENSVSFQRLKSLPIDDKLIVKAANNKHTIGLQDTTIGGVGTVITFSENHYVTIGTTLRILPGTTVKFARGASLVVYGVLLAIGTPTDRIMFTSLGETQAPGNWNSILCYGGGPDTLSYCDITYGRTGLWFESTSGRSLIDHCIINNCLDQGIIFGNFHTSYPMITVQDSHISNNGKEGICMMMARADLYQTIIDSNGSGAINGGIYIGDAYLSMEKSRIQYNVGIGIEVSGTYGYVRLTLNGDAPGYNTLFQNYVGELYLHAGGRAFLGQYHPAGGYWDCRTVSANPGIVPTAAPCTWISTPEVSYGGSNNVVNYFDFSGKIIRNSTSGKTVIAHMTNWGNPSQSCTPNSGAIVGAVDVSYPSCSPYSPPRKVASQPAPAGDGGEITNGTVTDNTIAGVIQYQKHIIDADSSAAYHALEYLAELTGPGKQYAFLNSVPWEEYLASLEISTPSPGFKSLVSAYRIQAKMNSGDFRNAISLADDIASRASDNDLWTYCKIQKIIGLQAQGDIPGAIREFNALEPQINLFDPKMIEYISDRLSLAYSISTQSPGGSAPVKSLKLMQGTKPSDYVLLQNYPNPFNPATHIQYQLPEESKVSLKIFNLLGQEIATLVDEVQSAGYKSVVFNANSVPGGLPSGVYFYQLTAGSAAGGFSDTKKLILME